MFKRKWLPMFVGMAVAGGIAGLSSPLVAQDRPKSNRPKKMTKSRLALKAVGSHLSTGKQAPNMPGNIPVIAT